MTAPTRRDRLLLWLITAASCALVLLSFPFQPAPRPGINPVATALPVAAGQWQLPPGSPGPPISAYQWQFDFAPIENLLAQFSYSQDQGLQLPRPQVEALQNLITGLQDNAIPMDLERLEWLITQSFPGDQGLALAQVFVGLYQFQAAQRAVDATPLSLARLHQELALQQALLGTHYAALIFADHNRMRHYLLLRQEIQRDAGLSDTQRQLQLQQLQQRFEAGAPLSPLPSPSP